MCLFCIDWIFCWDFSFWVVSWYWKDFIFSWDISFSILDFLCQVAWASESSWFVCCFPYLKVNSIFLYSFKWSIFAINFSSVSSNFLYTLLEFSFSNTNYSLRSFNCDFNSNFYVSSLFSSFTCIFFSRFTLASDL